MSDLIPQIIDGTHTRANVNAVIGHLEECGARRVPIDPRLAQAISGVAAQLMDPKKSTPRMQAAGAKLVMAALKHNLEIALYADKSDRLDSGKPTESIKMYGVDTPINDV